MSLRKIMSARILDLGELLSEADNPSSRGTGKEACDIRRSMIRELERRVLTPLCDSKSDDQLLKRVLLDGASSPDDPHIPLRLRAVSILAYHALALSRQPYLGDVARLMALGDGKSDGASLLSCRDVIGCMLTEPDGILAVPKGLDDRVGLTVEALKYLAGSNAGYLTAEDVAVAGRRITGSKAEPDELPTYKQILDKINSKVIGSDLQPQVRCLAARVSMFLAKLKQLSAGKNPCAGGDLLLLIGPSGSGKTHLLRAAAEASSLPSAIVDASSLSATGFVGGQVEDGLKIIMRSSATPPRGVYVLDELDKRVASGGVLDIQAELLTMVQGDPDRIVGGKRQFDVPPRRFDTRYVFYGATGCFYGLDRMAGRFSGDAVGFGAERMRRGSHSRLYDALKEYGMIEELINRTTVITLPIPTVDSVVEMTTSPNGMIATQNQVLAELGTGIEVHPEAVRLVASHAVDERSYARGVQRVLAKLSEIAIASGGVLLECGVPGMKQVLCEMEECHALE